MTQDAAVEAAAQAMAGENERTGRVPRCVRVSRTTRAALMDLNLHLHRLAVLVHARLRLQTTRATSKSTRIALLLQALPVWLSIHEALAGYHPLSSGAQQARRETHATAADALRQVIAPLAHKEHDRQVELLLALANDRARWNALPPFLAPLVDFESCVPPKRNAAVILLVLKVPSSIGAPSKGSTFMQGITFEPLLYLDNEKRWTGLAWWKSVLDMVQKNSNNEDSVRWWCHALKPQLEVMRAAPNPVDSEGAISLWRLARRVGDEYSDELANYGDAVASDLETVVGDLLPHYRRHC